MSYLFEGLMRIVAAGIEGFIILINGLIGAYNSVAWLYGGTIDYISNPAWDYANKLPPTARPGRPSERSSRKPSTTPAAPAPPPTPRRSSRA